jgi:type I restriction enzyme S subunit
VNQVFGDVLRQHTRAERISDPADETFVTLRLNGNGAVKRNLGEGKTPQPFTGYRVKSGQFIYSRIDARNGAFAIIPTSLDGAVVSKDFPVFDIDTSMIDPGFLLLCVSNDAFVDGIRRLSFGATNRQRVKEEIFLDLPLELPPLEEQRRIAAILDKADELRIKRREALAHLDNLTQSIFHSMFGDPNRQEAGWPQAQLAELGRIATGKTPPARLGSEAYGGSMPFVTPGDLGKESVNRSLSDLGAQKAAKVAEGSLLVCCIGATIGKMGIATQQSSFNQQINAVEWSHRINPYFGFHAARSLREQIIASSTSTTMPILNKTSFSALMLPVPPLELQQTFATRVAAVERLKQTHRKHLAELDTLFASLQHRAFKGEL